MAKKKEIATKETQDLGEFTGQTWGSENVTTEDLIVPKILLMQATSALVADGKASPGHFVHSMDKTKLGDKENPVEIIIFGSYKSWVEYKDDTYLKSYQWTAENADQEWNDTDIDGAEIQRKLIRNYYCLLPKDIESGIPFPMVLSCKGMSAQAGKWLATKMKMLEMFKKPAASKVFKLTCHVDKNDKGTFQVMDCEDSRDATIDEMKAAYMWYQELVKSQKTVIVDETDEEQTAAAAGPAPTAPMPDGAPQVRV